MKTYIKVHNGTLILVTESQTGVPVEYIQENLKDLPIDAYCNRSDNTLAITVFLGITEINDVALRSIIYTIEFFINECLSFYNDMKRHTSIKEDAIGTLKHHLNMYESTKPDHQSTEKDKNIGSRGKRSSQVVD